MDALIMDIWTAVKDRYELAIQNGDPRTAHWPLMQTPWPTVALCIGYLAMCWVGPSLMEKRKPFELRPILIAYNFSLVLLSIYMFLEFFLTTKALHYTYVCDPVVYSPDEYSTRLASVIWLYYFSKIVEFLDTLFFILRKKNNQITVLHVYHHSTMVFLWWIGVKWYAGGTSFFSAMVNCLVHVVMYSYYCLSACGPAVRRFLWWKKYLTILQLVQFVLILGHVSLSLYMDCPNDKRPQWALVVYAISHLFLFSNFYNQSYIKRRPAEQRSKGQVLEGSMANGEPAGLLKNEAEEKLVSENKKEL